MPVKFFDCFNTDAWLPEGSFPVIRKLINYPFTCKLVKAGAHWSLQFGETTNCPDQIPRETSCQPCNTEYQTVLIRQLIRNKTETYYKQDFDGWRKNFVIERFTPGISQVQCCNDARQAAEIIHHFQPDIIFLDIRMPCLDGFGVLNQIRHKRFKVIFTTAYNEYTLQAIRFSAFDYLLKPVDAEDLVNAVQRYLQTRDEIAFQPDQPRNILHNIDAGNEKEFRLALASREDVYFIRPRENLRFEAMGSYTKFFWQHNKQYRASKVLGEYEELLLPHGFIRTHKSHLVNKNIFLL